MQPEYSIQNEVQEIEDAFLAIPIGFTIIQLSQGDSEEVIIPSVQSEYVMLRAE